MHKDTGQHKNLRRDTQGLSGAEVSEIELRPLAPKTAGPEVIAASPVKNFRSLR